MNLSENEKRLLMLILMYDRTIPKLLASKTYYEKIDEEELGEFMRKLRGRIQGMDAPLDN